MRGLHEIRRRFGPQDGFTVIELAIVLVVTALLLLPALKLALESVGSTREQLTEAALEEAANALIAYGASNNGCLPFAADSEGGLPDTDLAGAPLTDTGFGVVGQHAGDLPWSELGLTESFRDGDHARLQYYVATPYAGASCAAGFRGFEYHSNVDYQGGSQAGEEVYVYYGEGDSRKLYKITGQYAAGIVPPKKINEPGVNYVAELNNPLPATLLEVRRGPVIDGPGGQSDVLSARNVFVLIAAGKNRNAVLDRRYMRDSTHAGDDTGAIWALGTSDVDAVVFSQTTNIDADDRLDDGDDTLRVMSFLEFKARLRKFGLNMEAMCDTAC